MVECKKKKRCCETVKTPETTYIGEMEAL